MERLSGCSLMVELQLPKLIAWVRFPSPAPYSSRHSSHLLPVFCPGERFLHSSGPRGSFSAGTSTMTRTPFSLLLSAALALAVLTGCGDRDDMPPITGERATDAGT